MSEEAVTLEELTELLGEVTDYSAEEIREEAEDMEIAPPEEGLLLTPEDVAEATDRDEEEVREQYLNAFNVETETNE